MRAFIQCNPITLEPFNPNVFNAYYGLRDMGFECIMFSSYQELISHHHLRGEIIVGGIEMIRKRLLDFSIDPPVIDYPQELSAYLGRIIVKRKLSDVTNNPDRWPVFIKSQEQKKISGKVIRGPKDLMGLGHQGEDPLIYTSQVLDIKSEYRVFVRYGKILDIKHYHGDPLRFPSCTTILESIEDYTSAPDSYGIDFGVLGDGRTILIEVNDAWALGCYGLEAHLYAKFLLTRWAQLTETIDEFFYI